MNKLFVRLAASGAIAASLGAPAFASSAYIDTTGPYSTNTVTSTNCNDYSSSNYNRLGLSNWDNQWSRSGNSWTNGNTWAHGWSGGGNAYNTNATGTGLYINNSGHESHNTPRDWNNSGSSGNSGNLGEARVHLTGPDSYNRISYNNSQSYNSENFNNVDVSNHNNQSANTGNVYVTGNTVVHGADLSSGNASNYNSTGTAVEVNNGSGNMGWTGSASSGFGGASFNTTGPDSYNSVSYNNSSRYNQTNVNSVDVSNSNHQQASSGDVVISHNTVVDGLGGSGNATNTNHTATNVSLTN